MMLASRRSWWRIAATIADQTSPVPPVVDSGTGDAAPGRRRCWKRLARGQVWSWDITDLRSPWRGVAFKAYSIIDIYSRKLVGWRVEDREVDHLAVEMFEPAFAEHGLPRRCTPTPDRRCARPPSRTSSPISASPDPQPATGLQRQPVLRVRVPHHEVSTELPRHLRRDRRRPFLDRLLRALVQPSTQALRHRPVLTQRVHDGTWPQRWQQRDHAHQAYYDAHPERFRTRPNTASPPIVGINLPTETEPKRLQAA